MRRDMSRIALGVLLLAFVCSIVSAIPCPSNCRGRGTCNTNTGVCWCDEPYFGESCSLTHMVHSAKSNIAELANGGDSLFVQHSSAYTFDLVAWYNLVYNPKTKEVSTMSLPSIAGDYPNDPMGETVEVGGKTYIGWRDADIGLLVHANGVTAKMPNSYFRVYDMWNFGDDILYISGYNYLGGSADRYLFGYDLSTNNTFVLDPSVYSTGYVYAAAKVGDLIYFFGDVWSFPMTSDEVGVYNTTHSKFQSCTNCQYSAGGVNIYSAYGAAVWGTDIYVFGDLFLYGGVGSPDDYYILKYDTVTGAWSSANNGAYQFSSYVRDAVIDGANVYLVGTSYYNYIPSGSCFYSTGSSWTGYGTTWSLYSGSSCSNSPYGYEPCYQAACGGIVQMAGVFDLTTGTLSPLPGGGVDACCSAYSVEKIGDKLFIGGSFSGHENEPGYADNNFLAYDLITGEVTYPLNGIDTSISYSGTVDGCVIVGTYYNSIGQSYAEGTIVAGESGWVSMTGGYVSSEKVLTYESKTFTMLSGGYNIPGSGYCYSVLVYDTVEDTFNCLRTSYDGFAYLDDMVIDEVNGFLYACNEGIAGYVAVYNLTDFPSTTWYEAGSQPDWAPNSYVRELAIGSADVFVAGSFSQLYTGSPTANIGAFTRLTQTSTPNLLTGIRTVYSSGSNIYGLFGFPSTLGNDIFATDSTSERLMIVDTAGGTATYVDPSTYITDYVRRMCYSTSDGKYYIATYSGYIVGEDSYQTRGFFRYDEGLDQFEGVPGWEYGNGMYDVYCDNDNGHVYTLSISSSTRATLPSGLIAPAGLWRFDTASTDFTQYGYIQSGYSMGKISAGGATFAESSTSSGPTNLVAGTAYTWTVQTRNLLGQKVNNSDDVLAVNLAGVVNVTIGLTPGGSKGNYSVTFVPTLAGSFSSSVITINGDECGDSLFDVTVAPDVPSPADTEFTPGYANVVAASGPSAHTVFVTARDRFGNLVPGTGVITGTLRRKYATPVYNCSGLSHPSMTAGEVVATTLSDFGNGTAAFRYGATAAGEYEIDVLVNGVAVPGSPLDIDVHPGVPSPSSSCVEGDISTGLAGELGRLLIRSHDQFGNPTSGGHNFFVEIRGDSSTTYPIENFIGYGTYRAQYQLSIGGIYTVTVMYTGVGVSNSPLALQMQSVCPPGQYSTSPTTPCQVCAPNYYTDVWNTVGPCTKCPDNTINSPANCALGCPSIYNCTCKAGYDYAPGDGPGDKCVVQCGPGEYRDNGVCVLCGIDKWNDGYNQPACTACPLNSGTQGYFGATAIENCTCFSGYIRPEEAAPTSACEVKCGPGTYRTSTFGDCIQCPANTYSDVINLAECRKCPDNTEVPDAASTSVLNCTCREGYYHPDKLTGVECDPCPEGGYCEGGKSQPKARAGYMPVGDGTFEECATKEACPGDGECGKGYEGSLCAKCAPNYYKLGVYCKECTGNPGALVGGFVFLSFLFCFALVWFNMSERAANRFASLVIGLNSLQISAIYGRLDVNWPYYAQRFFDILSIANFNLELVSPECSVTTNDAFFLRWTMTMLLPVYMIAMFALVYLCLMAFVKVAEAFDLESRFRHSHGFLFTLFHHVNLDLKFLRHTCMRSFYQIMTFFYLPLCSVVFEFFDCVPVGEGDNKEWVIATAKSSKCYTKSYFTLIGPAIIFALLYSVGIPLFFWALLTYKKKSLQDFKFFLRYGFLVGRFKEEFYNYELYIMLRKLGVVLCMAFFTNSVYIKAGGALLVLFISYSWHIRHYPYRTHIYNVCETIFIACAIFVLFLSILFLDTAFTSEFVKEFSIISILLVNVLVIVGVLVWDFVRLYREDAAADAEAKMAAEMASIDESTVNEYLPSSSQAQQAAHSRKGSQPAASQAIYSDVGMTVMNGSFNESPSNYDSGASFESGSVSFTKADSYMASRSTANLIAESPRDSPPSPMSPTASTALNNSFRKDGFESSTPADLASTFGPPKPPIAPRRGSVARPTGASLTFDASYNGPESYGYAESGAYGDDSSEYYPSNNGNVQ